MIPFAKLYFSDFSSGKESVSCRGNSRSFTDTAGELCTCFLASVSSCFHPNVPRRRFCPAAARTCPRSGCRSTLSFGFLTSKQATFEGKPDLLFLLWLQVEGKVGHHSVSLCICILLDGLQHHLERRGQEVPFYGGQSFAEDVQERPELLPSCGDAMTLGDNCRLVEGCESLVVECDFEGGFLPVCLEGYCEICI